MNGSNLSGGEVSSNLRVLRLELLVLRLSVLNSGSSERGVLRLNERGGQRLGESRLLNYLRLLIDYLTSSKRLLNNGNLGLGKNLTRNKGLTLLRCNNNLGLSSDLNLLTSNEVLSDNLRLLNVLGGLNKLGLLLDNLGSVNLVFNFIVFNSGDLSGLGNVISSFLIDIFSSLNGNLFDGLNGDLFGNGVIYGSGYIFFLVFNGLVISPYSFSGNLFNSSSFDGIVFDVCFGNLIKF